MLKKNLPLTLAAILLSLNLSGCGTFDMPSQVTDEKIELVRTISDESYVTSELTSEKLAAIAKDYRMNGEGPMSVAVTYDSASTTNTEANATHELARISNTLRAYSVKNVAKEILPAPTTWSVSRTIITYNRLSASMDENCGFNPGFENREEAGSTELHQDYKYGCTIYTLFAEQLANPEDLKGRAGFEEANDGRRLENVVEGRGYYGASPFGILEGESTQ